MSFSAEIPLVFTSGSSRLLGILHRGCGTRSQTGVLILVGGPQYRVGSHRQFVLMARAFAAAGYPVMRFDYRGSGDSEGAFAGFEAAGSDVHAAIDAMTQALPGLRRIVLWGLCDAASTALMYCHTDPRVSGVIIVNPWVRTQAGEARAYLRHYYGRRLLQASFWRKVISGEFAVLQSLRGLARDARRAASESSAHTSASFVERMQQGLMQFKGPVLCLISGRDLTAAEFQDLCSSDKTWRRAMSRDSISRVQLPDADHTFSSRESLDEATRLSLEWLGSQCAESGAAQEVVACR